MLGKCIWKCHLNNCWPIWIILNELRTAISDQSYCFNSEIDYFTFLLSTPPCTMERSTWNQILRHCFQMKLECLLYQPTSYISCFLRIWQEVFSTIRPGIPQWAKIITHWDLNKKIAFKTGHQNISSFFIKFLKFHLKNTIMTCFSKNSTWHHHWLHYKIMLTSFYNEPQ